MPITHTGSSYPFPFDPSNSSIHYSTIAAEDDGGIVVASYSAVSAPGEPARMVLQFHDFGPDGTLQGIATGDWDAVLAPSAPAVTEILPLEDGSWFLVWEGSVQYEFRNTLNVFGQHFAADGTALTEALPLFEALPDQPYDYSGASATLMDDGSVAVTAIEQGFVRNGQDAPVYDVNQLLRLFDIEGTQRAHRVVYEPDLALNEPPLGFTLLGTGDGDLAIVSASTFLGAGVEFRGPDGTVLTENQSIGGGAFSEFDMAALSGGGMALVWHDNVRNSDIHAAVFDRDNTLLTGTFTVNTDLFGPQLNSRVVALPEGGFVVIWLDLDAILTNSFDPEPEVSARLFSWDGTPLGPAETLIAWDEPARAGQDIGPEPISATLLSDGQLLVETEFNVGGPRSAHLFDLDVPGYVRGTEGDDHLTASIGPDVIRSGDGADTVVAGTGNDTVEAGDTEADLRDVVYGGEGQDSIDGGHGNDELRGDAGNDTITGGSGVDTIIGGVGDDVLTGQTWSDVVLGGNGNDFINGGFGHDRVNGGTHADRFYHLGVEGHGSDWIQDFSDAEGDVLVFGGTGTLADFQVNFSETEAAGQAGVEEAFVIYKPTQQILWALVDGAAQDHIDIVIGGQEFDLLG